MSKFLETKIIEAIPLKATKGQFGIEIEMEGNPRFNPEGSSSWSVTHDGSLKGDGAKEYVLKKPLALDKAKQAVVELYNNISSVDGSVNDSMRAGVHVHVNCQQLTTKQMFTFLAAYYCIEDCLVERFGEERQGNLFCLRLTDSPFLSNFINTVIRREDLTQFGSEAIRYSAGNLTSLIKFGSIEFRAMQTQTTPEGLLSWLDILSSLYNNSLQFGSPVEILDNFSADGIEDMLHVLLGDDASTILTTENYRDKIYQCIRNTQFWVYANNWS